MFSVVVTKWAAASAALVVTAGGAAVYFLTPLGDRSQPETEVKGVTITAPDDADSSFSGLQDAESDALTLPAGSTSRSGSSSSTLAAPSQSSGSGQKPGGGGNQPGNGGGQPGGGGGSTSDLEVTGNVSGLYPGHTRLLPLKFENANNFAVDVVEMTIDVNGDGSCSASELIVPSASSWTPARVGAGDEPVVNVPVAMRSTAGTECAGVSFTLQYAGKAVKA
jgi:hypothetical protein